MASEQGKIKVPRAPKVKVTPETKECAGCGKMLPAEEFYEAKVTRDGLGYKCIACLSNESKVKYREKKRKAMEDELESYIMFRQGGHTGDCQYCGAECEKDKMKCDKCVELDPHNSRFCARCFLKKPLESFPYCGVLCCDCNQKMRVEHKVTPIELPSFRLKKPFTAAQSIIFDYVQSAYQRSIMDAEADHEMSWKAIHSHAKEEVKE